MGTRFNLMCKKGDSGKALPGLHGAYLSASATVEASIVIPIFIYAVMSVMYIIQMISVQVHIQESLYNVARSAAKYAYLYDCVKKGQSSKEDIKDAEGGEAAAWIENGFTIAALQAMLIKEAGTDYAGSVHILGGNAGYVMAGSRIMESGNDIVIRVSYAVRNPFDIFGIAPKKFVQQVSVTAWLGNASCTGVDADKGSDAGKKENEEYVYITQNGSVYHTDAVCTYLNISVEKIGIHEIDNRRNAGGGRYYECEYCLSHYQGMGECYISQYGDRYHLSANCPKIERSVMKVPLSSVGNMKQCSKCRAKTGMGGG